MHACQLSTWSVANAQHGTKPARLGRQSGCADTPTAMVHFRPATTFRRWAGTRRLSAYRCSCRRVVRLPMPRSCSMGEFTVALMGSCGPCYRTALGAENMTPSTSARGTGFRFLPPLKRILRSLVKQGKLNGLEFITCCFRSTCCTTLGEVQGLDEPKKQTEQVLIRSNNQRGLTRE